MHTLNASLTKSLLKSETKSIGLFIGTLASFSSVKDLLYFVNVFGFKTFSII